MKFLNPGLLYALFALAIPIIIHLFNFQRFKKVLFTQVRFLQDIQQQTRAQSRLKHLLVLASRLLALTFLILAFAQPYIASKEKKVDLGSKAISIYVDNSFSMDAVNSNGRLLEQAKAKAREIASAYEPTDAFQLVTNDFDGRHQRMYTREEWLDNLNDIKLSPASRKLSEVYTRQKEVLKDQQGEKIAYLISDFQKSNTDLKALQQDTSVTLQLVALQSQTTNNIYIDSVWFENPVRMAGKPEVLTVRIRNNADAPYENVPLKLILNNEQKAIASINANANEDVEVQMNFTADREGIQYGKLSLTDYPLVYDDDFYFSYNIEKHINLLGIYEETESRSVNSLFADDEYISYTPANVHELDYSVIGNQYMIILDGLKEISSGLASELVQFVKDGGSIFIFPPSQGDMTSTNEFLASLHAGQYGALDTTDNRVASFARNNPLYQSVFEKIPENMDFPMTKQHFQILSPQNSQEEKLMTLQDGHAFISRFNANKGSVYACAIPSDDNRFISFGAHGMNALTLYQAVLNSHINEPLFYTIGQEEAFMVNQITADKEDLFSIQRVNKEGAFIPEQKRMGLKTMVQTHDQITEAGLFTLKLDKLDIRGLAFNYPRNESETACFNKDDLKTELADAGLKHASIMDGSMKELAMAVMQQEKGIPLWRICILLALLMLGVETVLIRILK
ncbi:MAG: BatA domain-containing protein [Flavobacteriales bacterium]|nr:BatA domain-containing protein [Flavobacteriales bacterium]MCB9447899.1 BatA domain-containing protein [Flavobacteriales bacterium]